jgi:predicted nuclease of predicted toxin-antitoxin system
MNLSPLWVQEVGARGHDAVHWRDIGSDRAEDAEIIAWAIAESRAVLTADLDFGAAVVRHNLSAPVVVQLRTPSTDPDDVGAIALHAIETAGPGLAGGAILTIEPASARLRSGPARAQDPDET